MTKPVPPSDEFQDPLEDFDPKDYADALEQALVEEELSAIRHEPYLEIPPTTSVHEAVKSLASHHIACLLVTEKNKLVGVFSERDVLTKIVLEFDEVKDRPVSEVMTTDAIYVNETDSAVAALSVMALCGYRHVPVVDLNDNVVGIVSPQRVTEFLQSHFQKD